VVVGVGVVGDRYATRSGYWSDPKWPDQEITLVEAETAADLEIDPAVLRRNLVTEGIALDTLIGATFQIGEAWLYGVRRCDPCRYLDTLTRPGLAKALAHRGGLRARILLGGRIRVGDEIQILSRPPA
jgi:MOSC domain-containing protein YiiM